MSSGKPPPPPVVCPLCWRLRSRGRRGYKVGVLSNSPDLEVATGEHGHVHSLDEGDGQPLDPPDRPAVEGDSDQDWLAGPVHTVVQTYLTQQISLSEKIGS